MLINKTAMFITWLQIFCNLWPHRHHHKPVFFVSDGLLGLFSCFQVLVSSLVLKCTLLSFIQVIACHWKSHCSHARWSGNEFLRQCLDFPSSIVSGDIRVHPAVYFSLHFKPFLIRQVMYTVNTTPRLSARSPHCIRALSRSNQVQIKFDSFSMGPFHTAQMDLLIISPNRSAEYFLAVRTRPKYYTSQSCQSQ